MPNTKSAIYILTQNTPERKVYLKTSLYFLFKNFNKEYKYPIIILHENDYDDNAKKEINMSIREDFRYLLKFKKIDDDDMKVPDYIDMDKLNKIVNLQPVPYWRNINYRNMCHFWIKHFIKYVEDYDYVMRLDDDSIIEEFIKDDLFNIMDKKELVYISNIVHADCGICNYGMKELFENIFPEKKAELKDMFVPNILNKSNNTNNIFNKITELYKIVNDKEYTDENIDVNMPIMYYNNFFITSTAFWKREDVQNVINKILDNKGIYYYRYGDAPLQTLIVSLMSDGKISRCIFKYSKRLQRECFIDSNNNFHSFMPKNYDSSSCITENQNK